MGFGLDRLRRERFDYRGTEQGTPAATAADQFAGLPVWTPGALLTTYRQLEARFRYYEFSDVTIDRYRGPNGLVPVALAVREIEPGGIEDRNWQNLHIRERLHRGDGRGGERGRAPHARRAAVHDPFRHPSRVHGRRGCARSPAPGASFGLFRHSPSGLRHHQPHRRGVPRPRGASGPGRPRLPGRHPPRLLAAQAPARAPLPRRQPAVRVRGLLR